MLTGVDIDLTGSQQQMPNPTTSLQEHRVPNRVDAVVPMGIDNADASTFGIHDVFTRQTDKTQIEREVVVSNDSIGDVPGLSHEPCLQRRNGVQILMRGVADAPDANPGARLTVSKYATFTSSQEAGTGHAALADEVVTIIALGSKRMSKSKLTTNITKPLSLAFDLSGFNAKTMQRGCQMLDIQPRGLRQ